MNPAHIHLLLNHFPIIISIVAFVIFIIGFIKKNDTLTKTAFWLFIASAIFVIPVYLTGEPAENIVEKMPGVNGDLIENHEKGATWAIIYNVLLGLYSAVVLFLYHKKGKFDKKLMIITIVLCLFSISTIIVVGSSGGKIHHMELREGFNPNTFQDNAPYQEHKKDKD